MMRSRDCGAYASLEDLPEAPELALVILPAKYVIPTLESCAQRGVKAAVVISAGFGEIDEEGTQAQGRMRQLAHQHGMVICGPNSVGIMNFIDRIPLSFGSALDMKDRLGGRLSLVSQSGGMLLGLTNRSFDTGIPMGYAVATGNEADLDLTDTLAYLAEDPHTDVLLAIIESVRNGPGFLKLCDRLLELEKPLIAYKIGRSEKGRAAAFSHTGALAESYPALQAVFRQRGVIEARDIDDLFELAGACLGKRFPEGSGTGVLTGSGGAGAIAADWAHDLGLELPPLASSTIERLRTFIPDYGSDQVGNPYDTTAVVSENPSTLGHMAAAFLEDPGVHGLVAVTVGAGAPGRARVESLAEHTRSNTKPVLGVVLPGSSAAPSRELLMSENIPAFHSPGKALEAMAALRHFWRSRHRRQEKPEGAGQAAGAGEQLERMARSQQEDPIEYQAKRFLAGYGIPVVEESLAGSSVEAIEQAKALGYPVALKIQSPQIQHKTEVGGVQLDLQDDGMVEVAYRQIMEAARQAAPQAEIAGMLVSRMVPGELELIAGVHTDPTFGPLILLGLGGIWVEAFDEVAMRPAPLSREDVREMVGELRGSSLLKGARGLPAVPTETIESILITLSEIAVTSQELLQGIDINPLMVTGTGELLALDASLYLK